MHMPTCGPMPGLSNSLGDHGEAHPLVEAGGGHAGVAPDQVAAAGGHPRQPVGDQRAAGARRRGRRVGGHPAQLPRGPRQRPPRAGRGGEADDADDGAVRRAGGQVERRRVLVAGPGDLAAVRPQDGAPQRRRSTSAVTSSTVTLLTPVSLPVAAAPQGPPERASGGSGVLSACADGPAGCAGSRRRRTRRAARGRAGTPGRRPAR